MSPLQHSEPFSAPDLVRPAAGPVQAEPRTRVRWMIVTVLFLVTTINYADRATLSITAPAITKQYGISAVTMGYLFSAFGWSYVLAQLPGGWLLDRFGAKRTYLWSLLLWSLFTLFQGTVGFFAVSAATAVAALFACRFLVGVAEAPSMPANSRIVAGWVPTAERGTAVALFNSAQYFATALFIPIMSSITFKFGWNYTFLFMGGVGILFVPVMARMIDTPARNTRMNHAERDYILQGGALNETKPSPSGGTGLSSWACIKQLLSNRMMAGIFLGQYCISTLTYFFLTWFPIYLVKERGMSILQVGFVAVLPALCGCLGGLVGGAVSDLLLRRGCSLSVARKTPIVAGMLLSTSMVICNYVRTDFVVVAIMALAFFGKGIGALGWTVIVDAAPKEAMGLTSGLFNFFGNMGGITTPIVIGYIVAGTGSFNGALVFVSANALMAIVSFLIIVPRLQRMELRPGLAAAPFTQIYMSLPTVSFIGTGVMGRSMAGHLLKAGHAVHVYNRTKTKAADLLAQGAVWHDSAGSAAAAADVVITMLGFPVDVETTYLGAGGIVAAAKPGSLLIDMTTSSPVLARRIALAASSRGISALDAPVSGGDVGAKEARLVIMVGGNAEAFSAAQPILALMGKNIARLGGPGAGQHCKMANQIAVAVGMVAWCEALAYAKRAGLDPAAVHASISGGAAGSWALTTLAPRALAENYAPGFYVKHILKDIRIALESAAELKLELPGLACAKKLYDQVAAKGWEDCGTQALYRLYLAL